MPARSARRRMSASSALSFIGPNVLNSGSIQIGHDDEGNCGDARVEPPSARALLQEQIGHPDEQHTADDSNQKTSDLVSRPLTECLVRQSIRMLAYETLVVRQRYVDNEKNHRERDEIERQLEEPFPATASRPFANSR